ncbi:hypothetical protein BGZ72_006555 [Mortierella alpina]|nr:hypothetical protein BGZ72_006555 [Mortierella alpina]
MGKGSSLSAQDALELANVSLKRALDLANIPVVKALGKNIYEVQIAELCVQAESTLSRIKRSERHMRVRSSTPADQDVCDNITANYERQLELWNGLSKGETSKEMSKLGKRMSKRILKKQRKWQEPKPSSSGFLKFFCCGAAGNQSLGELPCTPQVPVLTFPEHSTELVDMPALPTSDTRLIDTPHLVYSLRVLQVQEDEELAKRLFPDGIEGFKRSKESKWAVATGKHAKEYLRSFATPIATEFINDKFNDDGTIAEVTCLAAILSQDHYRTLVSAYIDKITSNLLTDLPLVQGLPRLIQSAAKPDYLQADDLVKILRTLSNCLQNTHMQLLSSHQQSPSPQHLLVMAISRVLDAMTRTNIKGLNQEELHGPLSVLLKGLMNSPDIYLVYQASYALQALKNIPDNESPLRKMLLSGGEVIGAAVGLGIAVYTMNIPELVEKVQSLEVKAEQIFEAALVAFEATTAVMESGQSLGEGLRAAVNYHGIQPWYQELQLADAFIESGDLVTFQQLVLGNDHRLDPSFQWGVCQRLGEIAANPRFCFKAREIALNFLSDIFSNDTRWKLHIPIKQLIIAILLQLKQQPLDNGASAGKSPTIRSDNANGEGHDTNQSPKETDDGQQLWKKAEAVVEELGKKCRGEKYKLYHKCLSQPPYPYSLEPKKPSHRSTSLLERVQEVPDIHKDLEELKKRRLADSRPTDVYIEPSAVASLLNPTDPKKTLLETVVDFLHQDGQVLLLLGASGSGKSTFNQALEHKLWTDYTDKDSWIPLHINLPAIDRPHQDLIAKHLARNDFTERQIREMKKHSKFILICDGYDESQQSRNLYETNELTINPQQSAKWTAKMVISCRSEYLGSNYHDRFQPPPCKRGNIPLAAGKATDKAVAAGFKEVEIAPFTSNKIKEYVKEYVEKVSSDKEWRTQEYMRAFGNIPNLMDLVKNPFLLTLSLEVLPRVVDVRNLKDKDNMQELSRTSITRGQLYERFVEHWLEREKKRMRGKELDQQDKVAFEALVYEGFAQNGINFLKRLAGAIYKEQSGHPVVEYLRFRDEKTWKAAFFQREHEMRILREACPLIRSDNQYRFIHRSLLEYCFALTVFDPQENKVLRLNLPKPLQRRASAASISSCEEDSLLEKGLRGVRQTNVRDHPLSWKDLVKEPSILQFLVERVQHEPLFKKQLLDLIELSKENTKAHRAAANAITILVRSGHKFNGADLKGIKIRGADLSGGEFDSAQLQGADLMKVNFRNIWLREADLGQANMKDATFGESPYIVQRSGVQCCVYSPDGTICAMGLCNNEIKLHNTTTWKEVATLQGHNDMVAIVVYSPAGTQIASGSDDKTVRLWDPAQGSEVAVFRGHAGRVECVVYSPRGDLIASGSGDKTVRLWDPETKKMGHILRGHDNFVMSVVFSPSGDYIASGSYDKTVRIWNTRDGHQVRILSEHTTCVKSVVYSPDGNHIASASYDKTVRIWDSSSGDPVLELLHEGMVTSVAYSPNGLQIAAGCDKNVQLWDAKTGANLHILSGHTDDVTSVVYSPSGHQIASSSHDKTARLWDTQSGAHGPILSGHVNNIASIVYAPNGHQIATAGLDKTVRLWDSQTGASVQTSTGHTDRVTSVTYSPTEFTLASGGFDKTVRLWNAKTGEVIHILGDNDQQAMSTSLNQTTSASINQTTSTSINQTTSASINQTADVNANQTPSDNIDQTASNNVNRTMSVKVGRIERIVYSPNGKQIALGSEDMFVYILDVETGGLIHRLKGHVNCVTSLAYSPDGKVLVSGSDDWGVFFWDAENGIELRRLVLHEGSVTDVAYSPCGNQIASGSSDKTVIVLDAASGDALNTFTGHSGMVTSVVYSPNGKWIASGSNDKTIRLWNTLTGEHTVLEGHTDKVRSVAFSPSGEEIASGSIDSNVRLWEVASGKPLAKVKVFQSPVRSIAWVKNDLDKFGLDKNDVGNNSFDSFLATGSDDKSVRVWGVRRTEDEKGLQVQLHWNSMHDRLVVSGAQLAHTKHLSDINKKLVEQRDGKGTSSGVVEEQLYKKTQEKNLRVALTVTTAIGKMRTPGSKELDNSSAVNASLPTPPQEKEHTDFSQEVPVVA